MAKVTSKLQVTIPKAIAEQYGIEPGDELDFLPAGDAIRVVVPKHPQTDGRPYSRRDTAWRLKKFDEMTERIKARTAANPPTEIDPPDRGWTREDAYEDRGFPR